MAKIAPDKPLDPADRDTESLGEYAHQVIEEQYQRIVKQEKKVLADKHPEALHQMRVGTRRLRTALQVFEAAIVLPKAGNAQRLRKLARILGEVRDLDVQLANIQEAYYPNLDKSEQRQMDQVMQALTTRRKKAFASMEHILNQPLYQTLKTTYEKWLKQPEYGPIAQLPISVLLPDLLSPLLSELLLHPGWLISVAQVSHQHSDRKTHQDSVQLHDLRKLCKHVRYQAEFFIPFYPEAFQNWIEEIKTLQDQLGDFQDSQVFLTLLTDTVENSDLPELTALVNQKQQKALANWEAIRQQYLDRDFRRHLYQMLLQA